MYRFFKRLLSSNYWRMLVSQGMWTGVLIAVRRAHKDKRARKRLWDTWWLLMPLVWCVAYLVWVVSDPEPAAVVLAVLVVIALRGWYRRLNAPIREAQDVVPPHMYVPRKREAVVTPELRTELAELALLHAVLADRAGSESFLRTKVLPEGFEVVTRQRHMEILREYSLYDRLGDAERDLMLLPDGHWPPDMIDHVAMLLEPLRLLRWVLRVDGFLPTVGATMSADFRLAGSIVKEPTLLFRAEKLIEIDPVRIGFTAADHYFYRCWAEGVYRKLFTSDTEEAIARATEYASRLHGNEGEDMLLGTVIVSKANDADVRLGATLALRRAKILDWLQKRMYGEVPAADRLEGFYLR